MSDSVERAQKWLDDHAERGSDEETISEVMAAYAATIWEEAAQMVAKASESPNVSVHTGAALAIMAAALRARK